MFIVFFIAYGLGVLAILGDITTTMEGLKHGLVEANPIPRYLFPRIGQAFTGWLGGVVYTIGALFTAHFGFTQGTVYCLIVAGAELYFYLHNKALLKTTGTK